jgi:helicase
MAARPVIKMERMIDPRETDDARSAGRCEREVADVGFPFGFLPGKRSEPRSRSEIRHVREQHRRRARNRAFDKPIRMFYDTKGKEFEGAFENLLSYIGIECTKLDKKPAIGAPDYLMRFSGFGDVVIELKTKEGVDLVNYNDATKVLATSEVHGHKDKFCVTLCNPGVDPSVPNVIVECGRLAVVEVADLGEALLRICEGSLPLKTYTAG